MKTNIKPIIPSFKEFLNESPIAVLGDWGGNDIFTDISYKRKFEIAKRWTYEDSLKIKEHTYEIYSCDNDFILGVWGYEGDQESFFIITRGGVMLRKDIIDNSNYKHCYQMKKIYTTPKFRGEGITKAFYKWFLVYKGYQIISDMVQYDGARQIYSKLSKEMTIQADIWDSHLHKVIANDVEVDHGPEDWEFDPEYYSYDFNKANILIVLYI